MKTYNKNAHSEKKRKNHDNFFGKVVPSVMNNVGEFNTLVEEVIEFSKSYDQFSLETEGVDKIQVIHDHHKAEYLAYEEVYGEEEYS